MNIKYISAGIVTLAICLIFNTKTHANTALARIDSIGVENIQGKQVILHRLQAKETYYSLSRTYQVQPKDIISFNNNKSLKIGDIIKVPTNRTFASTSQPPASSAPTTNSTSANNNDATQYIVGPRETLYTIARRFQVSVAQIVERNNLKNNTDIKSGQTIYIPKGNEIAQQAPQPVENTEDEVLVEEPSRDLPSNRYGLKQINEKGVGVWLDGLNAEGGNMLALHKTAPVGTVVKITNPMTQKSTFAKIVGKYTDNSNTKDAVIVISKSTANLLGILDKRFLINISYGLAN